jgi:hypothetical protein
MDKFANKFAETGGGRYQHLLRLNWPIRVASPGRRRDFSVKDGKLWTQSGTDVEEYFPLGADSFFIKPELGIATFSRDAQGHVTGYTYLMADDRKSTSGK